jgi:hypothetical protein
MMVLWENNSEWDLKAFLGPGFSDGWNWQWAGFVSSFGMIKPYGTFHLLYGRLQATGTNFAIIARIET